MSSKIATQIFSKLAKPKTEYEMRILFIVALMILFVQNAFTQTDECVPQQLFDEVKKSEALSEFIGSLKIEESKVTFFTLPQYNSFSTAAFNSIIVERAGIDQTVINSKNNLSKKNQYGMIQCLNTAENRLDLSYPYFALMSVSYPNEYYCVIELFITNENNGYICSNVLENKRLQFLFIKENGEFVLAVDRVFVKPNNCSTVE